MVLGLSAIVTAATVPYPVALSGDAAPGVGSYTNFDNPVLNASGQVAFLASLIGVSPNANEGIYLSSSGSIQAVAVEEAAAPAGGDYGGFANPQLNAAGKVAFITSFITGTPTSGIIIGAPGSLQTAAYTGTTAPGGATYNNFITNMPALNASGQVAFNVNLTSGASIIAGAPGSLQAVAIKNDPAPAGGNYNGIFSAPAINASGQVAFSTNLSGGSATSGVFVGAAGSLQPAALGGSAAPSGGNYNGPINTVALNNAGQVAFLATLNGGSSGKGIFAGAPGSIQTVALQSTAAPAGGNYNTLGLPIINTSGKVAFQSTLTGGSSFNGIYTGLPGSLQAIALSGMAAPQGGGATFTSLSTTVAMNSLGVVLFTGSLTGAGVDNSNNFGLYAGTPGNLELIIRRGDLIDVDPSAGIDIRTVFGIGFTTGSGGEDGRRMSLNDSGLVTYRLTFTDLSFGLFTSQVSVPEPASLGLLGIGGMMMLRRRRR